MRTRLLVLPICHQHHGVRTILYPAGIKHAIIGFHSRFEVAVATISHVWWFGKGCPVGGIDPRHLAFDWINLIIHYIRLMSSFNQREIFANDYLPFRNKSSCILMVFLHKGTAMNRFAIILAVGALFSLLNRRSRIFCRLSAMDAAPSGEETAPMSPRESRDDPCARAGAHTPSRWYNVPTTSPSRRLF